MIRVVFDTNITVAAFFWTGLPRQALRAAYNDECQLISSEILLIELAEVLSRPRFAERLLLIGRTVETLLANYRLLVEIVEPDTIVPVIVDDPDDDHVLACALKAGADCIVSRDKHLLKLGEYNNIPILNIEQFIEKLK